MELWIPKVAAVLFMIGTLKAEDVFVNTPSGPIRGRTMESFTRKQVDVYYGIPFAEPPVGELRFRPPVEVKSWQAELNATTPSRACYQKSYDENELKEFADILPKKPYSEDCLKLHIWVPKTRRQNSTVMVYIHGGGYSQGHPLTLNLEGATLAAEENVIVVSMNYRLSVQGYLYFGIPDAPGNMGLMDQQMALKWVRRNIASFGGNPDDVTIFGMSAGGSSVGFHLLSPGSRDTFKRAILMSGTPNAVWSIQTKDTALNTSMRLAQALGCGSDKPKELLQCMKSLSPEILSDWKKEDSSLADLRFLPTVDGTFISDYPMNLLSKKDVKYADIMIGNTADEGSLFMQAVLPDIFQYTNGGITEKQFQSSTNRTFKDYDNLARELIPLMYTDWTRPNDPYMWRDALKDLLSDYLFTCTANDFTDLYLATNRTVYRYIVDHHFASLYPAWIGTAHGSDTFLHLGMFAGGGKNITQDEVTLSRRVMRWFGNFARTGNPNALGQSGPLWYPSTLKEKEYMRIAVKASMEKHFRTQTCTMVNKMMKVIEGHPQHCHN